MTTRKSLTSKDRIRLFTLHRGVCHFCLGKIIPTIEGWEVSHEIPLELGGADDDDNRKPSHKKCHRAHTSTVDAPNIARAKRRELKNLGAAAPKKKWPSRPFSRWRQNV